MSALSLVDFTEADDPVALFEVWLEEAARSEINDPEAMALATVDEDGTPDARMMLCKGADTRGLVFYTNIESAKGRELAGRAKAAALFHWKSLRRQVRFRGVVHRIEGGRVRRLFRVPAQREPDLRAWASQQSRPLASRDALETAVEVYERRFASEVPRPDYWRGYRLAPVEIEFWRDGASRLHDRIQFKRANVGAPWEKRRLFP